MRIAGVGTLISSGLVFGYLGSRPGTAYATALPPCSSLVPGGISTDDSFNAAVAAVNAGSCNVIDIAQGFTFHTAPALITGPIQDDSLTIIGLNADDSVLNGDDSEGLAIEVTSGLALSVSTLAFTAFDDTVGLSQSALSLRAPNGAVDVHLSDVSFTNNYSGGSGGAVYINAGTNPSNVGIDGTSHFAHNTARLSAGAVFTKGAIPMDDTLTIDNAIFADNTSLATSSYGGSGGGAIQASVVIATDSQFLRNESANQGGAVSAGSITATDVLFQDDSAPVGGAIQGGNIVIGAGTRFDSNEASNKGGAIDGSVYVKSSDVVFTDNRASNGGAIYTSSGYVESQRTVFTGNDALNGNGGAIRTTTGTVWSIDDSFSSNTATSTGGAVFAWLIPVHIEGSDFYANEASIGGAIATQSPSGTTVLNDSRFDSNYATTYGGAVAVNAHVLETTGTTFTGNVAHIHGGAIYSDDTLMFTDDTFADNHAATGKGGAAFANGNVTAVTSTFTDDTAAHRGGAIYVYGATSVASITGSSFINNSSVTQFGGAVASRGDVRAYDSLFSLNEANGLGGAIYAVGSAALGDDTFVSNTAGTRGGAVYAFDSLDDTGSNWVTNMSFARGGAAGSHGTVTLESSEFISNTSADGGAIYSGGTLRAEYAYFFDNAATASGGAVWANGPAFVLYSTFTSNEADDGGAVFNNDDTMTLTNTTIVDNSATGTGGAVRTTTGAIHLRFSTLVGNVAPYGSAVGTNGPNSLTQVSLLASVLAGDSGPLCDNLNPFPIHYTIDATATSAYSFATDTSCGSSIDSINTTFTTLSALGFDDTTLTTDDSTGQQVLIPDDTSVLAYAVPNTLVPGVTFDQLRVARNWATGRTTAGAVQVRPTQIAGPQAATVAPGANADFSVVATPGVGTSLSYQWQSSRDGSTWSNIAANPTALTAHLTLSSVPASDNGLLVRVQVTDISNTTSSTSALLTVASPGPTPAAAPTAPRDPQATAGDAQATITWDAPVDPGSYPITTYQVRNDIDGTTCLLTVDPSTRLACTVTGLANGRAYRFSVRALNGAGWGSWSQWTASVTPRPTPPTVTITIVGSRDHREVSVLGTTTGLVGQPVRPMVRIAGQASYAPGKARIVRDDGRFTWTRVTAKKVFVYFTHADATSNRVVIPALRPR